MANIFKFLILFFFVATLAWGNTNETILTNGTSLSNVVFVSNRFVVPNSGLRYPEVQAIFATNQFSDVYESDTESALRRFEIEFFIALPPVLIINTLLLKGLQTFQNGYIGGEFDITRNIYLYSSSLLIAGSIAFQDYNRIAQEKRKQGLSWPLFHKKF